MANGMGALWVAASGLQSQQNALNVTANNLANLDTKGYVRQQTIFGDNWYKTTDVPASISKQTAGLGVSISDVLHNRDVFLDQSYRTEFGRNNFYDTLYGATSELETLFQEMDGESFQEILTSDNNSLWVAFQEFAKDPSSPVNQSLILQKASLFVTDAQEVYAGMRTYQSELSTQIKNDIDRINEIGHQIYDYNHRIQAIEAAGIETASDIRDARDLLIDELSSLVKIKYNEAPNGIVSISIEGVEFLTEGQVFEMAYTSDRDYLGEKDVDSASMEYGETNYLSEQIVPIWPHLQNQAVFHYSQDISSEYNNDIGKLKALYFARGNTSANYSQLYNIEKGEYISTADYQKYTGGSVTMNKESEFDWLIHSVVTAINDLLCPNTTTASEDAYDDVNNTITYNDANGEELYTFNLANGASKIDSGEVDKNGDTIYKYNIAGNTLYNIDKGSATEFTAEDGTKLYISNIVDPIDSTKILEYGATFRETKEGSGEFLKVGYTSRFLDVNTTSVGIDVKLPPQELFSRVGVDRYTTLTYEYTDPTTHEKETRTVYMYNEEDPSTIEKYGQPCSGDTSTMYSIKNLKINDEIKVNSSLIHYKSYATEEINYEMSNAISELWKTQVIKLNPEDTGLKTFAEYYEQMIGELGTEGNIYKTTTENLEATVEELEARRQSVIGVSSDEELTSMIKFQNAYNASSRFFNVVDEMIEHILTQLGS